MVTFTINKQIFPPLVMKVFIWKLASHPNPLARNLFEYAAKADCTGTTNQPSVKFVRPHSTNHFVK